MEMASTPSVETRPQLFIRFRNVEHDLAIAKALRATLLDAQFSVWWREDTQCAGEWHRDLNIAVRKAGYVVVLWSKEAIQSPWVQHEASAALARDVYAPLRIGSIEIEPPFNRLQATDIPDGDNIAKSAGYAPLLQRVTKLIPPLLSWVQRVRRYVETNARPARIRSAPAACNKAISRAAVCSSFRPSLRCEHHKQPARYQARSRLPLDRIGNPSNG